MMQELYIILGGLVVGAIGWFTAMAAGRKQEQANQIKRDKQAMEKANEVKQKINSMSNDDIRDRGRQWVRDTKR